MTSSLVSVCLITYNHEKYIRQAMESVLMQKTDFSWEIIIADDCSTDDTRQIILEYKNKYPNLIKLLFQEKNVGGGKNFLDLINAADGKYIAYIEGDDYWTDVNKLQMQFDFMESHQDFSLCYHQVNWEFMYESEDWQNYPPESNLNDPGESTIYDILNRGWFIRSSTMFFRNMNLPEGFEKLIVGDYPLHILLADMGRVGFIKQSMSTYRIHNQGLSETNLLVDDIKKKYRNNRAEIFLINYLNKQTKYKYKYYFQKRKFDEIYSFNHFLFFKNKRHFIANLFYTITNFNPIFLVRFLIIKARKRVKYLHDNDN